MVIGNGSIADSAIADIRQEATVTNGTGTGANGSVSVTSANATASGSGVATGNNGSITVTSANGTATGTSTGSGSATGANGSVTIASATGTATGTGVPVVVVSRGAIDYSKEAKRKAKERQAIIDIVNKAIGEVEPGLAEALPENIAEKVVLETAKQDFSKEIYAAIYARNLIEQEMQAYMAELEDDEDLLLMS